MLQSIRGLLAATVLSTAAFVSAPALAQDEEGDITISGNAALVSEYRFRGVDLSGGDIAIQGGVDVGHSSGFYIGTWASSLDEDTVGYGHTELDLYGGWSGEVTPGLTVDVGALYYAYPNAPAGDYDYWEFYGSLGYAIGPIEATAGVAYAPSQDSLDFGGGKDDNLYLYVDLGTGIPNTPISLSAHLGYTDGVLTYTNNSKAWDYSIGADFAVNENLSIGVAYVNAEDDFVPAAGAYNFTDGALVGTLSVSF